MPDEQVQFLNVLERDEARRRWFQALSPACLETELIPLGAALGRILARDIASPVDVPAFDRANVDGYAVRAADTFAASEQAPRRLRLNEEAIPTGVVPRLPLDASTATPIATGARLPRGADAVVMIEHTWRAGPDVEVRKAVAPGANITFAGTDVALGEFVLAARARLTSRETGILAAIGLERVAVVRRPVVAVISTGDELVPPGAPPAGATVYDSNQTILADAIRELGGLPVAMGIVPDDEQRLDSALAQACRSADLVLLSGGTSKGGGDLCARVLARHSPGIIVHGVALRPGKPLCLGAIGRTPVAILPGFPTSAIFTFHTFIAPLVRTLAGSSEHDPRQLSARLPARLNSERGRTDFVLVNLLPCDEGLLAYPLGKGSGSVTTFSRADGFITIPTAQQYVEAGETVAVTPLAKEAGPADLVVIGSHCVQLDQLLACLRQQGFTTKTFWVGSQGGLDAVARGACDLAGIHLFDPASGRYNAPFVPPNARLFRGYTRMQGVVVRGDDARFDSTETAREAVAGALLDDSCVLVNRNRGSGTRILIDECLAGARPPGYSVEARSHNAVAAAVAHHLEPVPRDRP